MSKLHTHYENLRVIQGAPQSVIKAAYRALAQENHPDRSHNPDATRILQVINDAYAVLSDPTKRAAHDKWIASNERAPNSPSPTPKQEVRKSEASESKIENLRKLHRADLHQMRQVHALEVNRLKRFIKFEKKMGIMLGLLLSIPIYIIFSSVDDAINKAHAAPSPQYQETYMRRN